MTATDVEKIARLRIALRRVIAAVRELEQAEADLWLARELALEPEPKKTWSRG